MKKKIIAVAVIILIIIIIFIGIETNLKKSNSEININMQKLADDLINSQIFEDNLSTIDRESIIKRYNLNDDKIKDIVSYLGTGATAEEILIIEFLDKNYINEAEKSIKAKIDERKVDFQDYLPKEVFKLENYNLKVKGNYLILCISNDYDKAETIIKENINS